MEEIINIEEPFEVRDLRGKDRFQVDDEFLNGYGKIVGPIGISVYVSLCRYSDKTQKCWPSQKKIAEEIKVSEPSVNEYLKILASLKIIKIKRIGKACNNRYWLLNKKQWLPKEVILSALSSGEPKHVKFTTKARLVHYQSTLSSNSKELNSKELNSKELTTLQNQDFANTINHLVSLFKEINPSYKQLYSNKTQRSCLERLVKEHTYEKVEKMILFLPEIITKKYAPRVTTPLQLEDKLGDLKVFIQQQMNDKPKVAKIR